jgi:Uma2 family endonuclease
LLFIIATFTEVIITDYSLEQVTLVDIPEKPLVFLNMEYPLKKESKGKITWKEYISSKTEERYEVIDGEIYDMSPSPSERHQTILGNFYFALRERLKGTPCRVYLAPLDVYLDEFNFVQPDIFVVCDREKIKDRIYGAPDIIIEILSPFTSLKDKRLKKALYEKFGVKEYIIVHPDELIIERYLLIENKYTEPDILGHDEVLKLTLHDIEIPLTEIFE